MVHSQHTLQQFKEMFLAEISIIIYLKNRRLLAGAPGPPLASDA